MKVFELAIFPYIQKQYNSMFKDIIEKYDITQVEIDILAFFYNNPEYHYAQDIVKIRGINKGHASIGIDKLVKKGLLERIVDQKCRRCHIIKITEKAIPIIKDIVQVQQKYKKIIRQHISVEEKEIFDRVLYQMYINLGGYQNE
ncbi:MAG: MarR family winged helix-turn-helix transcriptional regulator [Faecalibacillus sp.]